MAVAKERPSAAPGAWDDGASGDDELTGRTAWSSRRSRSCIFVAELAALSLKSGAQHRAGRSVAIWAHPLGERSSGSCCAAMASTARRRPSRIGLNATRPAVLRDSGVAAAERRGLIGQRRASLCRRMGDETRARACFGAEPAECDDAPAPIQSATGPFPRRTSSRVRPRTARSAAPPSRASECFPRPAQ